MNSKFLRIYKKLDLDEVKAKLLICGDLSASCANCNHMGLKIDTSKCPQCAAEFKYLTFRNIRENMAKMLKLNDVRPDVTFVDFDDFKRMTGALKAEEFFK
jgi:hypothetical protein